jgi:AraC-like DNA-binding protein
VYRERPSQLVGSVVWTRSARPDGAPVRIVPDGCLDLIWTDGDLVVAGPDTGPHLAPSVPGGRYDGLRFAPGTGPAVLGVPAVELRDRRVPLSALWPAAAVRRLAEQVSEAGDRGTALEALAVARLRAASPDPLAAVVARNLRAGRAVAATADLVGLSERQLHRRSLALFGYGPKTLVRVLRMSRAVELARDGMPFASVASVAGYADQAHLARDVKALTGLPLGELLSA